MKLVAATNNHNKVSEFRALLGETFDVVTMRDVGVAIEVDETETTFFGNALLKAKAVSEATGFAALADDSGLEVDALDDAPGVYSARYAGEPCDDAANNQKLLRELQTLLGVSSLTGLRLLNQNSEEMIYSFIISQNNNIPRIKLIISRICEGLGQRTSSPFGDFYAFPSSSALAAKEPEYYRSLGAGYRDVFISDTARRIAAEGIERLYGLPGDELRRQLLTYKGVGPKVADCICLFGFGRRDAFPVDTWIEKLYREDFGGTLTDRNKINAYFTSLFGQFSGYMQQYLFYAKRSNL